MKYQRSSCAKRPSGLSRLTRTNRRSRLNLCPGAGTKQCPSLARRMRVTGCKDMFKKQHLIFAIGLSLAAGTAAGAESPPTAADPPGFYGGVSLRSSGREADGLSFGHLTSVWSRFTLPTSEDAGARTLAYGGYRWANDLSVEAALATVDR